MGIKIDYKWRCKWSVKWVEAWFRPECQQVEDGLVQRDVPRATTGCTAGLQRKGGGGGPGVARAEDVNSVGRAEGWW
jgi:hypothetical protein